MTEFLPELMQGILKKTQEEDGVRRRAARKDKVWLSSFSPGNHVVRRDPYAK
jgi:hypothetical protein